jgi:osmoprotectant transport system substrate-binding protein
VAELYARALRQAGIDVEVLSGLGTRELVAPALQQGQVDLVVDYAGSLLDYLGGSAAETHGTAEQVYAALRARLAGRGLTALRYAPAEDANAFAVRAGFARQHQLSRLSDLRPLAGQLTFGGPPECPTRRYCLQGLHDTYRLQFAAFRPQPSRGATATALASGEIDVGLLETTSGQLGQGGMTLLVDDRSLQPRENLVPVVRTELVRRYGSRLAAALDGVSARLTTGDLVRLNHIAAVDPVSPAEAVAAYLRLFGP